MNDGKETNSGKDTADPTVVTDSDETRSNTTCSKSPTTPLDRPELLTPKRTPLSSERETTGPGTPSSSVASQSIFSVGSDAKALSNTIGLRRTLSGSSRGGSSISTFTPSTLATSRRLFNRSSSLGSRQSVLSESGSPEWTSSAAKAAGDGDYDTVMAFLQDGGDPNAKSKAGTSTPLSKAASRGHIQIVELLLEGGAAVNLHGRGGMTPLHEAAGCGQLESCKVLLGAGAAVAARDHSRRCPLHYAGNAADVTQLLLEFGADPDAKDKNGKRPENLAVNKEARTLMKDARCAVREAGVGDNASRVIASLRRELESRDLEASGTSASVDQEIQRRQQVEEEAETLRAQVADLSSNMEKLKEEASSRSVAAEVEPQTIKEAEVPAMVHAELRHVKAALKMARAAAAEEKKRRQVAENKLDEVVAGMVGQAVANAGTPPTSAKNTAPNTPFVTLDGNGGVKNENPKATQKKEEVQETTVAPANRDVGGGADGDGETGPANAMAGGGTVEDDDDKEFGMEGQTAIEADDVFVHLVTGPTDAPASPPPRDELLYSWTSCDDEAFWSAAMKSKYPQEKRDGQSSEAGGAGEIREIKDTALAKTCQKSSNFPSTEHLEDMIRTRCAGFSFESEWSVAESDHLPRISWGEVIEIIMNDEGYESPLSEENIRKHTGSADMTRGVNIHECAEASTQTDMSVDSTGLAVSLRRSCLEPGVGNTATVPQYETVLRDKCHSGQDELAIDVQGKERKVSAPECQYGAGNTAEGALDVHAKVSTIAEADACDTKTKLLHARADFNMLQAVLAKIQESFVRETSVDEKLQVFGCREQSALCSPNHTGAVDTGMTKLFLNVQTVSYPYWDMD